MSQFICCHSIVCKLLLYFRCAFTFTFSSCNISDLGQYLFGTLYSFWTRYFHYFKCSIHKIVNFIIFSNNLYLLCFKTSSIFFNTFNNRQTSNLVFFNRSSNKEKTNCSCYITSFFLPKLILTCICVRFFGRGTFIS